jgi:Bacterial toxin 44
MLSLCPPASYPFPSPYSAAGAVQTAQAVQAVNLELGMSLTNGNPYLAVAMAQAMTLQWWYNQELNPGSEWDFKRLGSQYDAAGNFTFGAVGTALGYSPTELLNGAGLAKMYRLARKGNISDALSNGLPGLIPPFGNQAGKQGEILQGVGYFYQMTRNCIP